MAKTIKIIVIAIISLVMASCAGKQGNNVKKQGNNVNDVVEITPSFTEAVHQFEELYPFSEGMAAVRKDGKFGFINIKGELVIPCQYLYAGPFKEGLACVIKDENNLNISFIDKEGNLFKTQYTFNAPYFFGSLGNGYIDPEMLSFQNGVCEINYADENVSETQTVYIDKQLKEIKKPSEENTTKTISNEYEVFSVSSKDIYGDEIELKGLKDKDGKIIIPAKYNNLQLSDNGVALATMFVEDAESHLHPYKPFGLQIDGYVDFTGKSTFTEADKGKLEGYKDAQLSAMSQLKLREEEQAQLEEEQRIQEEENRPAVREVIIEYTAQHNKVNSVKASHGYSLTMHDEDILSDMIVIPQGKKWIFKGINKNSGARIITYSEYGGALRRDKRFDVSTSTRETYQFYGGDKIRVAISTIRPDTYMESAKIVFTFIEKPEYD